MDLCGSPHRSLCLLFLLQDVTGRAFTLLLQFPVWDTGGCQRGARRHQVAQLTWPYPTNSVGAGALLPENPRNAFLACLLIAPRLNPGCCPVCYSVRCRRLQGPPFMSAQLKAP